MERIIDVCTHKQHVVLEPCPFCGGKAFLEKADAKINGKYMKAAFVRCCKCYARTSRFLYYDNDIITLEKAKQDAIAAWNMRCKDAVD